MPTDTERREVARRLRRAWANVLDKNPVRHHMRVLYEVYAAVGLNDDDVDAIDLFDRLADLIEPSGHECVPGECPLNVREMRHSTKEEQAKYGAMLEKMSIGSHPVDRDALLSLADEIGTYRLPISGIAVAEHIREALGVDDDEA